MQSALFIRHFPWRSDLTVLLQPIQKPRKGTLPETQRGREEQYGRLELTAWKLA